jgi:hypothetical protein
MMIRPRSSGLRVWAAALSIYALLLHGPAMVALGHAPTTGQVVADQRHAGHGDASGTGTHQRGTNACCAICSVGACTAAPVGNAVPILPIPQALAKRLSGRRSRVVPQRPASWFRARGPPLRG